MIHLATCCTTEQRKTSFVISKFLIKIDSSDLLDITITYNENLMTSLWDSGIVTVARYCNWCETFNIIFSETNISSSFSFKMTDGLVIVFESGGFWWGFFELAYAIFVDLHFVTSSVFSASNGVNLLLFWKWISFEPLCLLLLFLVEWAICQLELFMLNSLFCLVLPLMVLFVIFLSLLRDKCSTILSLEF